MTRKERHCKLYQQIILKTDVSLNAFGICPKCLWDIADHENEPPSQSGICFLDDSHRCILYAFDEFYLMIYFYLYHFIHQDSWISFFIKLVGSIVFLGVSFLICTTSKTEEYQRHNFMSDDWWYVLCITMIAL